MAIKTKDPGLFANFARNVQDGAKKAVVGAAALTAGFGLPSEVERVLPIANLQTLHAAELKIEKKLPYTVGEVINALVDDQVITFDEGKVLEPKLLSTMSVKVPVNANYTASQIPSLIYKGILKSQELGILNDNDVKYLLAQDSMINVANLLSDLRESYIAEGRDAKKAKEHYVQVLAPKYFGASYKLSQR